MNLLFISHDATLTGAPILLLNLIRLLKEQQRYSVRVIIKNGSGSLISEFAAISELAIWKYEVKQPLTARIANKGAAIAGLPNQNDKMIQRWIDESDIVVSNTITNGDFLRHFNFSKVERVLTYVHELEMATAFYTNPNDIAVVKKVSNHFLVPSKAVARHLMQNLGIKEDNIDLLNYYVPFEYVGTCAPNDSSTYIAGFVGTLDWRKGADILTVLVAAFFKKYPEVDLVFVWKGADKNAIEYKHSMYELNKLGLTAKLRFEAPSKEVGDFYNSIDILLLISKEDPYPLVVLEAASYSKPCICFEGAGGAPEFVQSDAGDSVPYLDVERLTGTLYSYYVDRNKGSSKGLAANSRYLSLHCNKDLIASQFSTATGAADTA